MRLMNLAAAAAVIGFSLSACEQQQEAAPEPAPVPTSTATVFEGARLIVGDGSAPIENGVIVIDGTDIVGAGAAGAVNIPEGAAHVDLTGKTVIPALVDTHVHLSGTIEGVRTDLLRRGYFGVSAAMSLGRDTNELIATRGDYIPGAARYFSSGRGITRPEPGRPEGVFWIESIEEGLAAVRELASVDVDIIKIWVDDRNGQYEKTNPGNVRRHHRRGE